MRKENKKHTTIPLAACLPAASDANDANDDDDDTARETVARALDALACASNEVCADVERRVDRLVAKAMEMDERVHACERKIANAQRRRRTGNNGAQSTTTQTMTTKTGHEGGEVLVLESSRKYVLVSDEDDDETETETVDDGKTGGERRPMYYDETTRNALQRANENKPKRRAFKDVERMATNARRYGESARALARSFAKKQGKAGREDGAEPKTKDIGDKDNGSQFSQYVIVAKNIASYDRTSLADMMPAKTAFYDCEELRFGGKGKDKRNAPGEEVTEDGNKEEGLRDNFAEKLLLSSPPPKSIAPPVMRSVRMPGAAENASTSTLGANDDGEASMSAKKSLESAFSFRPKASEAPVVVFPKTLPSPTPLTRKNAAGEQNRQVDGASDLYEFTLTSDNPYSPSAFLRDPRRRKAQSSASKKKKGESIPSTLTSRKISVRNNSDSSSNITINNRDAQLSSSSPPPPPPPQSAKQYMPPRVADDGGRGALMEAIRKGAKLRKVNASTDENAPRRSPVANTNDNDNSVASTTKTGTGETIKPATSRGSAQMSMMEELASQLQRRRSTVISSQKKSTK